MKENANIQLDGSKKRIPTVKYVVQITGSVGLEYPSNTNEKYCQVRDTILDWVQAKCPNSLPESARNGEDFEIDIPGHKFIATTLPDSDLWVVKIEHPSDDGYVWSVESELATVNGKVLFGLRSYRSSFGEPYSYPARTTPTFAREISRRFGLYDDGHEIKEEAWLIERKSDLLKLESFLASPNRALPVIIVTSENQSTGDDYIIDHSFLAFKSFGLAHVILLPDKLSYEWSDLVGKEWSVYRGAVRTYYSGLSFEEDDPTQHPLATRESIIGWESGQKVGEAGFVKFLINHLYLNSVSGAEWRARFASFADVKARKLASFEKHTDSIDDEVLSSYRERIKYLTEEKDAAESLAQDSELLKNQSQAELSRLNSKLFYLQSQNDRLLQRIKSLSKDDVEDRIETPVLLDDLSEWAEKYLPGRVVLHPRAIRASKKSRYENIELVYKSLLLLANEYRSMRLGLSGDAQDLFTKKAAELSLELSKSIAQERAGEEGDQYKVKYPPGSHKTRYLDLHLKNGTSRDERHCLRIYFFWDQDSSQVVVGSLPGHLDTRST